MRIHGYYSSFSILALLIGALNGNDDCDKAKFVTSFPFQENGDSTEATVDFSDPDWVYNNINVTCGINGSAKGVWYRILGNNQFLQASVTDIDNVKFKTAIFRGDSCGVLECMRAPSNYKLETERTKPTSTWFAEEGKTYYFHVTGMSDADVGEFSLEISKLGFAQRENDSCDSPSQVDPVSSVVNIRNFDGARPQELDVHDCGLHFFSRGLFYSFTGTGNAQNVTLTIDGDDHLELSILSSGCGECIYHTDFLTQDDSPYVQEFKSQKDKNYIAVVSGETFEDTGSFSLQFDSKAGPGSSGTNFGSMSAIFVTILINTAILFSFNW
mmetsp:Transcript_27539/g.40685  ORF Transcript_27539/g.40685 Transcript_27539/m.40685 type:complete len:327 (-) Transcript_27539:111-1091(-)